MAIGDARRIALEQPGLLKAGQRIPQPAANQFVLGDPEGLARRPVDVAIGEVDDLSGLITDGFNEHLGIQDRVETGAKQSFRLVAVDRRSR